MPIKLVRRPRSPKRMHNEVLNEIRPTFEQLGDRMITRLNRDVASWRNKPEFKRKVIVNTKRWQLTITTDRRTKAGKIWTWVDEGTGERGDDPAGEAYDIYPKHKKALAFNLPHIPKTIPAVLGGLDIPGIVLSSGNEDQTHVVRKHVHALGITPRHFSKSLKDEMKQRTRPGAFRSVTEAAIKRALRRIGKR